MNEKEAKRGEVQPCIPLCKCVGSLPMGLEPYLLATVSAHGDFERVEKEDIMSCIRMRFMPVHLSFQPSDAGLYPLG